ATLAVCYWQSEERSLRTAMGEGRIRDLNPRRDQLANKMQPAVANQCTREQPDLAQDLEAIARADDEPAVARISHDAGHDRRETRDRAAAEIIAKGKSARQHD